eukprot:3940233-Rhodomonas_salina.1
MEITCAFSLSLSPSLSLFQERMSEQDLIISEQAGRIKSQHETIAMLDKVRGTLLCPAAVPATPGCTLLCRSAVRSKA